MRRRQMTGAGLRRLRRQVEMTQAELAVAVGVTVTSISRWETGRYKIRQESQIALATVIRKRAESIIKQAAESVRS